MRSAVFLPTPGIAVSRATSPRSIARDQLARLDARQHRQRQLRADAADADQPLEQLLLERRREPVERERVLAHVGVDAQRDLGARLAEPVERRQRHVHVVADAADVDDDAVRLLLEQPPAQVARSSVGRRAGLRASSWRRRRAARRAGGAPPLGDRAGRAVHVTDRHRQRVGGVVRRRRAPSRPSSSLTICCTWCFSARP